MSQRLKYDDAWIAGEVYRVWIKDGSKRYRLSVSRELLEDLSREEPEAVLNAFEQRILDAAQWKLDEFMAEPGDGVTWLKLGKRDVNLVRFGAGDV